MADPQEIFEKVQNELCDALGVDEDEVTREATLVGDLGAESIDFLDILFRLERAFDIKIPRGELFPESLLSADSGYVEDGKINAAGIAELRQRLPYANVDAVEADPQVENVVEHLFTVDMLCKYLENRLAG